MDGESPHPATPSPVARAAPSVARPMPRSALAERGRLRRVDPRQPVRATTRGHRARRRARRRQPRRPAPARPGRLGRPVAWRPTRPAGPSSPGGVVVRSASPRSEAADRAPGTLGRAAGRLRRPRIRARQWCVEAAGLLHDTALRAARLASAVATDWLDADGQAWAARIDALRRDLDEAARGGRRPRPAATGRAIRRWRAQLAAALRAAPPGALRAAARRHVRRAGRRRARHARRSAARAACPTGATRSARRGDHLGDAARRWPSPARRSAASTITRTSCSVPEGRSSTRPVSPSSRSASATAARTSSDAATASLSATRTFSSTCGSTVTTDASSASGAPVAAIRAISRSAVSSPSPVVAWAGQDDVPGLLAAEREAAGAQLLEHVAVADRGGAHRDPRVAHGQVQPEVAHHGGDERVVGELVRVAHRERRARPGSGRRRRRRRTRRRPGSGRRRRRARCPGRRRARRTARRTQVEVGGADPVVDVQPVGLGVRCAMTSAPARR